MFWDAFSATLGVIAALVFLVFLLFIVGFVVLVVAEVTIRLQRWWIYRRNRTP